MPVPTGYFISKVKEINPDKGANITTRLAEFDGKIYFGADNGSNGNELWVTDGTEGGTYMLKNINLTGSSFPRNLTVMNGSLYFSANNGTHGSELWKTNGTASGTRMVREINSSGSAEPRSFAVIGTTLFFYADNGTNYAELWKTDGTAEGTRMVKDINPIWSSLSYYAYPVVLNGKLYFAATDNDDNFELWVSDGTTAGTQLVKDINPTGSSDPQNLTIYNETLYFTATNGTHGTELWKSDGTAAGTQMVRDIYTGSQSSYPYWLTVANNTLYFSASHPSYGNELWKSDGTTAGTVLVRNINTNGSGQPNFLAAYKNQVFFEANDGTGHALWKSDGTTAGTVKVKANVYPCLLKTVGNYLYFAGSNDIDVPDETQGLYRSDGTAAGTFRMEPNSIFGMAQNFTGFDNKVLFVATDGSDDDDNYELYKIVPCTYCPVAAREGTESESATGLTLTVLKNPTPDEVTVEVRGAGGKPLSLQLTNLLGQPIASKTIETAQALERHRFDVRTLPSGLLVLQAVSGDRSKTVRINKTD